MKFNYEFRLILLCLLCPVQINMFIMKMCVMNLNWAYDALMFLKLKMLLAILFLSLIV